MFKVETFDSSVKGVIYFLHAGDYVVRYVGLAHNTPTYTPHKRFLKHLLHARNDKHWHVSKWINEHGAENIQMCIIETFDEDTLHLMSDREKFHIAQNETYVHDGKGGMNGTIGGQKGSHGHKMSEESKLKISEANQGNISWRRGKTFEPLSEETRKKISETKTGVKLTPEHIAKATACLTGRPVSDETRAKISSAQKGKPNRGPHTRAHVKANKFNPECVFCQEDSSNQ